jgi:osmotically-inducible protein OsmY
MVRDPYVERFEIAVTVVNGVAYLEGVVDSYFEKLHADTVAAGVKGVVGVENGLTVRDDHKPYTYDPYLEDAYVYDFDWYDYRPGFALTGDAAIKRSIESQLWWSPFVDSDDIEVTVDNGVATLEGTVESWGEYIVARENALQGGAPWVVNNISIVGSAGDS